MPSLTEPEASTLLEAAKAAARLAYAPYSGFAVGSAVLLGNDTVVTGCNIENASISLSLCAERVALTKAISEGHKAIKAIAIWANTPAHHSVTPCGACRQVFAEFCSSELPVILHHPTTGAIVQLPLQTLLPYTFKL